ncbi:MAG: hypothetical protein AMXMBFR84_19660 [Candidatus Hydrogenedentota bacterium]
MPRISLPAVFCFLIAAAHADIDVRGTHLSNPALVQEAASGKRVEANAGWWGFHPEDATDILQAALDSGVKKLVIPFMGQPWITRPLNVPSNIEILFEPGVLLLAKRGEFKGGGDSLLSVMSKENVVIRGYGATLRMWKRDYQKPPYEKAEWRMGIRIMGSKKVTVEGLRIESSGGDGIYVGAGGNLNWCEDVTVRDCVVHDNHRQGISVISARNLLIENCVFSNTGGTPPEAGIDIECDAETDCFVNCVIRNCVFESNSGHAILVYLKPMTAKTEDISIRFENCHSRMGSPGMVLDDFQDMKQTGWAGISVGAIRDDGPNGLIEFINCTTENTGKESVRIYDKSADRVKVRFVNCSFKQPWVSAFREEGIPRVPILLHARRPHLAQTVGNVEFVNCHVFDNAYRPAVRFEEDAPTQGMKNVSGDITVHNITGARAYFGAKTENVTLNILDGMPKKE